MRYPVFLLTFATAFFAPAARAGAQAAAAKPEVDPRLRNERQLVCRGAIVPEGWILVDDTRDTSMCGGDNPSTVNRYNIWAIQRYNLLPVGTILNVCAVAQTPPGWVLIDIYRDRDACGHPDDPFAPNVKRIRRAR
ncbi:MAG TPA: hypothetical protein VNA89_08850 [Gemmatimonadaceae bacterium]|nr:hypothetical protein [Gemmatimonadaceae bacterium]